MRPAAGDPVLIMQEFARKINPGVAKSGAVARPGRDGTASPQPDWRRTPTRRQGVKSAAEGKFYRIRKREACQMDTDRQSRTRKKNEDRALQRLGEQLVALPFGQLAAMELPDELLAAIESVHKIRSRSARRRQIQYIGALMRHIDPQPIETALERIRSGNRKK